MGYPTHIPADEQFVPQLMCACGETRDHPLGIMTAANQGNRLDALGLALYIQPARVIPQRDARAILPSAALGLANCPTCHRRVIEVDFTALTNSADTALTTHALDVITEQWCTGALNGHRMADPLIDDNWTILTSMRRTHQDRALAAFYASTRVIYEPARWHATLVTHTWDNHDQASVVSLLNEHGTNGLTVLADVLSQTFPNLPAAITAARAALA